VSNISVDFDVLNQKGSPAWYSDVYANIPTAGYKGRMFISIDTYAFYRDTGTGWDLIGGPGTGTITGSGTSGQVSYFNGSSTLAGSNNLFWDITNSRLGIGTATPGVSLDIHASGTNAQFNGTGTNNAYLVFQNSGTSKWRIGNTYNAGANSFDIYNNGLATNALSINVTTNIVSFTNNVSINSIIVGTAAGSGSNNVSIGTGMTSNSTGSSNTSLGNSALGGNTTGSFNTGLGQGSIQANQSGNLNTAIGQGSLLTNTSGSYNTALGATALNLATGSYNTAIGQGAGALISTGTNNILIGYQTGNAITTGSNNTIIGNYVGNTTLSNVVLLADGAGTIRYQWDGTANTFTGFVKVNSVPISTYGLQVNNSLGNPGFVAYQNSDSSYALQMATTGATTINLNSNASASYINTAGNFGLGTASPSYKLDVSGTGRFTGILTLGSTISNGTYAYTLPSATGTLALTSNLSSYLPLTGGTLTANLAFNGTDCVIVWQNSGTTKGYTGIITNPGAYIPTSILGDLINRSNGGNFLWSVDSGSSAAMKLDLNGNLLVGRTDTTINTGNFGIRLAPDGSLQNSRNVNGSSSVFNSYGNAGEFRIYGNGTAQNTTGTYGTISDLRLKDNIINSTNKLEDLLKVRIVNYNLKKNPNEKLLGVIAQELEEIFPSLVDTNDDGIKGVKMSIFIPMIIKAIQELNDKLVKNNIN